MIRLFYWLIKRKWAICRECKYHVELSIIKNIDGCNYYKHEDKQNFVTGEISKEKMTMCRINNINGCCWGFKPKARRVEPSEPWPKE
jgi:hypothetical protein